MNRRSLSLSFLMLWAACREGDPPANHGELDGGMDGGAEAGAGGAFILPPSCEPFGEPLPKTLSCTGLYGEAGAGPAEKAVHPANREFAPGAALWSDGADKRRWIALPQGTQIDTTDANGWVFPERTRIWKEFTFQGKRVETRLMYKSQGVWVFAAYQWNESETEALAVNGAEVPLANGGRHSIPSLTQCNECHRGSRDKVLGFQQVLLGLPAASGLNLAALVQEQRLSRPPARSSHTIPDDGTGLAAAALPWLHVNCGVSCHNETGNAGANMSHMFLRIDPSTLDAASPADWNVVKMTIGVPAVTPNFFGGTRIVPGAPDESLIIQLAETRGSNRQMPPLGTHVVDTMGLATLREWIAQLGGPTPPLDAGMDSGLDDDGGIDLDAGVVADGGPELDAGMDAGDASVDAGVDAAGPDANSPRDDAAVSDAALM
jgi:hypothetical protein